MKAYFLFILLCLSVPAYATFSIVAVDTVTGEVGGAGASCIGNSRIINDFIMGVGCAHTQSYYLAGNQNYLHDLMEMGIPPEAIMDSLIENDVQGNPAIRQYGIVDLADGGRSAAFTGEDCLEWAGHYVGETFAVQGNILLGPEIVDTMVTAFNETVGPLADRLLAALVAAKIPGADTRCIAQGKSAISAFIRVARIGDDPQNPYCNLNVGSTTGSTDPIDVLEERYVEWLDSLSDTPDPFTSSVVAARDTLIVGGQDTTMIYITPRNNQGEMVGDSVIMIIWSMRGAGFSDAMYLGGGVYGFIMNSLFEAATDTVVVYNLSGERQREFAMQPVVTHIAASNANARPALPQSFDFDVFPNPFNSRFALTLSSTINSYVHANLYDIDGRLVQELFDERMIAGTRQWSFDMSSFASGIYFVSVSMEQRSQRQKIILLK